MRSTRRRTVSALSAVALIAGAGLVACGGAEPVAIKSGGAPSPTTGPSGEPSATGPKDAVEDKAQAPRGPSYEALADTGLGMSDSSGRSLDSTFSRRGGRLRVDPLTSATEALPWADKAAVLMSFQRQGWAVEGRTPSIRRGLLTDVDRGTAGPAGTVVPTYAAFPVWVVGYDNVPGPGPIGPARPDRTSTARPAPVAIASYVFYDVGGTYVYATQEGVDG